MGYFPFFVELSGKQGLIVGGGTVALRKIQKLLPYGPGLTVVAPEISSDIRSMDGLILLEKSFSPEDVSSRDFVIAATDDHALNHQIAELCKAQRILVNVVDGKEECSFLFPALVKRGNLSVGISTSGAGPTAAVYLKEQFTALLPERLEDILAYLETVRERAKELLPNEAQRKQLLSGLFYDCMQAGRPLTEAELAEKTRAVREESDDGEK